MKSFGYSLINSIKALYDLFVFIDRVAMKVIKCTVRAKLCVGDVKKLFIINEWKHEKEQLQKKKIQAF